MNVEQQNRKRIKDFHQKHIEKTYQSNPKNITYRFPKKMSSVSSNTSISSLPQNTEHTYNLHLQNHSQNVQKIIKIQKINKLIENKMKGGQGFDDTLRRSQKLKLISTNSRKINNRLEESNKIQTSQCFCFRWFSQVLNHQNEKEDKEIDNHLKDKGSANSEKLKVRESGINIEKRTIKKMISCEGKKKLPSTKNPSTYSKHSSHSPHLFRQF